MAQKTTKGRKKKTKKEADEIKSNHVRVTEGLGNGIAINFLMEYIEPFIVTAEIANGLKCGFFDAFQNKGINGDKYVATKEEIIEYATNGFVTIDDKDSVYDLEQFTKKLDAWLELMEISDIIYRNNGFYCLQPLAVHFRNDKNGIIRSLLNESFYWMKTIDEQNIWNRHCVDSLMGTQKYNFIEKHLETCSSVLSKDLPQYLTEFDIKLNDGAVVFDIGCGTGYFLEELARLHNNKIRGVGLDFNWKVVENGNKRLKELGLGLMVELRYMDVAKQKLPANNDLVDLVLTINLHQYFKPEHYEHLTNEIYRILKPGGTYFSVVAVKLPNKHPSERLSIGMHSQLSKIFIDYTDAVDMVCIRELYENAGFNLKTIEMLPLYGGIQEIIVIKK